MAAGLDPRPDQGLAAGREGLREGAEVDPGADQLGIKRVLDKL